jgi:hypothetical protein
MIINIEISTLNVMQKWQNSKHFIVDVDLGLMLREQYIVIICYMVMCLCFFNMIFSEMYTTSIFWMKWSVKKKVQVQVRDMITCYYLLFAG